jgi:hypothetical protein
MVACREEPYLFTKYPLGLRFNYYQRIGKKAGETPADFGARKWIMWTKQK